MPDMKHFHLLALLDDAKYYSIDVWFLAIKQMPEPNILGCDRA